HIVYNNNMEKNQQRAIITVVIITAFITTFTGSALNLSVPDIGDQFGVSAGTVGWLITGYTLAVAAFSVPLGRLADITCRKTVLVAGIVIFVVCCAAAVFSVSMVMLLAVRIIQGIGASMIFSTNTAVLISAFPGERRGRVLGYSLASTYVGLSAGPVIGGFLNYNFGWKSIFMLTGLLGAIAFFAAIFKLPGEKSENRGKSPDMSGNILYVIFIVMMMYGLSEIGKGMIYVLITAVGVILGILFIIHESRSEDPIVNVTLFRENKGYAFSNISAMLNYGATFAISYLISIYLQVVMGYSSQTAGLIMIFQPIIMAVLSPVMGRFSDRISPFKMSSVGMAFCAAGTFIFIFIGRETQIFVIIMALVITGLGFSLFSSPNTNAVMSCVDKAEYGVASSILATMRSIGHTLSMVIVTITVTMLIEDMPLADAPAEVLIKVIRISFIVFTLICTAGVFISLKRK
ncbi:MAG: MFS transporter, partial [Lentihominibacter sp.]